MSKPRVWRAPGIDDVDPNLFAPAKPKPSENKPVVHVLPVRKHIGPHEGPKFQGRPLGSYRRVELRRIAALVDVEIPGHWTQQEILTVLIDRLAAIKELRDEFDS